MIRDLLISHKAPAANVNGIGFHVTSINMWHDLVVLPLAKKKRCPSRKSTRLCLS